LIALFIASKIGGKQVRDDGNEKKEWEHLFLVGEEHQQGRGGECEGICCNKQSLIDNVMIFVDVRFFFLIKRYETKEKSRSIQCFLPRGQRLAR